MSTVDKCATCRPWPWPPCPIHVEGNGHGEKCTCSECFERVEELLDGAPRPSAFAVVDERRAFAATERVRDLQAEGVFSRMREVAHGRRD